MWGGFQALPGRSRAPGTSRGLQEALGGSQDHGFRLKFHAGWSGWTRPPCLQGGVEGVFRLDASANFFTATQQDDPHIK